jgi:hypothetical protein
MKTNLTHTEERLLDLFEKGFYHELSLEEQQFVLKNISEDTFNLEHKLRFESKYLYKDVIPKPLLLPKKNGHILRLISVSISSAAAAALITYNSISQQFDSMKIIQKPVYLMADTIFVPKVDTIIQLLNGKTMQVEESSFNPSFTERRELFVSQEELPPLLFLEEHHKSASLYQDRKDLVFTNADKSDVLSDER